MNSNFLNKYNRYLPSRKFTIIIGVLLVVAAIAILVFFIFSKKENFVATGAENTAPLNVENQTVNELVQNDTDGDGIADWEEALWGTDKTRKMTFNNTSDSTYIDNKKKELNIEQSVNVAKLTETEKFAREFFSSYTAMKATGEVDANTINGFSNAIGQKVADPNLIDRYTQADIKLDLSAGNNDMDHKVDYYIEIQKLFQSYQSTGLGDELDIVNTGLASGAENTPASFAKLSLIANAYYDFSEKMMSVSVPSELASYHLLIANSSNNTGIAVEGMSQVIADPLIGLQGLSQYQKYSEELIQAVTDLETAIVKE